MTLLSVVTPARNMAAYLGETLDSVAALAVPHEHLVMDGASDDGTVELLEAREDPHLIWVSERDSGQTEAVNKGLRRARGELLAWLNADDAYIPEAVDRAIDHLERNPETQAIYGGINYVDESVAGLIRSERLTRCMQDLQQPRGGSVTDIAFRWGFSSQAHFSRLFRARFGCSPSQARTG